MNWLKQAPGKPLFPDVLWSRPENRRHAGKLLIIGGHKQEFNQVSAAYSSAIEAGAGTVRVVLPDSLQKMLHKLFPEAEYAASTQIGSFSRQALAELIDGSDWADAVLLAGDFGRNSETAVMLESFVQRYTGKLALSGDSVDYFLADSSKLASRPNTLIIATLSQLQKLASPCLIQQNADLAKVTQQIAAWGADKDLSVITSHSDQVIAARKQQISTTPARTSAPNASLAAYSTVWFLQQPNKPFEALCCAAYCLFES